VINGFDLSNTFNSQGAGSVIVDRNDNYRAAATLTKIVGNHTFKFGAEWLRATHNYAQTNIPTGFFTFNPDLTGNNGNNPLSNSGAGLATFLLGYPSSGNASTPNLVAGQQLYPAVFGNDDWHVSPRLTLNLGVRWEHSGPWTERFDRLTYFNPTQPNQILAARGIRVPGDVALVNSTGNSYRSNIYPNWYQFAPRLGVAYQVTSKTVFHAGYGMFWLPNNVAWDYSPNNNPINTLSTPILAPVYPGVPATVINNPFPGGIAQPPGRDPSYAQILLGRGVTVPELENPYGYAQQWNADIQQQFGNGFLIDVAYGGAKGTHLPISSPNINQLPDQFLSLGDQLTTNVPNPYYGIVTAQGVALSQPTVQYGQLLRRYPQYDTVGYAGQGIGNSSYQSLQVKAEKRFSGGNTILVAYTHAKLIANTETVTGWLESGGTGGVQDWNNLKGERSLASFDTPDRLVASYVMDIPVGKAHKYLANANGLVQSVVGGWGVQGTTTLQTGFPLHFTTNQNNTHSFGGGSRPNAVVGCQKSVDGPIQAKLNNYFNTSCFTQPAPFTFGNESRTDPNLRSPGIADWNFAAVKRFPLSSEGRTNLVFRAEFFNIFNRVQFGYPNQSLGNTAFGRITSQVNNPRLVQFALQLKF